MARPGNTTQRGYGHQHQKLRLKWQQIVDQGRATCWRCGQPIIPGTPWDLGHDDRDRSQYRGPEHRHENRATAGRRKPPPRTPLAW